MSTVSYGLDLSGYSSGGSSLARAERQQDSSVDIRILDKSVFRRKTKGTSPLRRVNEAEISEIESILAEGTLVVDVCIDLQGLPNPPNANRVWQLTRRPVDRAFNALTPMADKIGAYVARMQRLLSSTQEFCELGSNLFETYPAASLELMRLHRKSYKGIALYREGHWAACPANDTKTANKNNRLAANLNRLGWDAPDDTQFSHDDFDAAICALTGFADFDGMLASDELQGMMQQRLIDRGELTNEECSRVTLPIGYRLLQSAPKMVHIVPSNGDSQ